MFFERKTQNNLYDFLPGITGLSQIKSIDMSDPITLSKTDYRMMRNLTLLKYFYYLIMTIFGKGLGDRTKVF